MVFKEDVLNYHRETVKVDKPIEVVKKVDSETESIDTIEVEKEIKKEIEIEIDWNQKNTVHSIEMKNIQNIKQLERLKKVNMMSRNK